MFSLAKRYSMMQLDLFMFAFAPRWSGRQLWPIVRIEYRLPRKHRAGYI